MLARNFLFFVDILFSKEEEYLKRRRAVKYLRNREVLILEFYPIFHMVPKLGKYNYITELYYRFYAENLFLHRK